MQNFRAFFLQLGMLAFISGTFFLMQHTGKLSQIPLSARSGPINTAMTAALGATGVNTQTGATSTPPNSQTVSKPAKQEIASDQVQRVKNPYAFPPESTDVLNAEARASLVNILCVPGNNSLSSISGSGVIIDPRGVILTNAHVAQYVLLAESGRVDISCTVRTGAPATSKYTADVLYIPPVWVEAHAAEITEAHPSGTGEHDYALLRITGTTGGAPLPSGFPAIVIDTREGVSFTGDQVLVASYPAEFLGSYAAVYDLYPASSVTAIGQLLTFGTNSIDLLSLGGVIEAQSGSSGGGVLNVWGRLVGIVTTTSDGTTTASRDLRALTLSYIDSDIKAQTGLGLSALLSGDIAEQAQDFAADEMPALVQNYLPQIAPAD